MSSVEERGAHGDARPKKAAFSSFFKDLREELAKLTWTEKGELITYTKVVFISVFVGGFTIYFMDLAIRGAMVMIGAISRMIGSIGG